MLNIFTFLHEVDDETINTINRLAGFLGRANCPTKLFVGIPRNQMYQELVARIDLTKGISALNVLDNSFSNVDKIILNGIKKSVEDGNDYPFYMVLEELRNVSKERLELIDLLKDSGADVAIGQYTHEVGPNDVRKVTARNVMAQKWFMLDSAMFYKTAFQTEKLAPDTVRQLATYKSITYSKDHICTVSHLDLDSKYKKFADSFINLVEEIDLTRENPIDAIGIFQQIDDIKIDSTHSKYHGKKISLMGCTPLWTGYGEVTVAIAACLLKMGFDVEYASLGGNHIDNIFKTHPRFKSLIVPRPTQQYLGFLVHPPNSPNIIEEPFKHRMLMTMWESSLLQRRHVKQVLNRCNQIFTPSSWSKSCFEDSGCVTPVALVPLGINEDFYAYNGLSGKCVAEMPFVFGTAGRLMHGGVRKGVVEVIKAFHKAFGADNRVRLRVKIYPDDMRLLDDETKNLIQTNHNIQLFAQVFSASTFRDWVKNIDCYVSGSTSEGWGLIQHQAACMGKPLITSYFGGIKEFTNEKFIYELPYDYKPASDFIYENTGFWAVWNVDDMAAQMHQVVIDLDRAKHIGFMGAVEARKYNYKNMFCSLARQLSMYLESHAVF